MWKYFQAKDLSSIIELYQQNALDAWQTAITKSTELKRASEWLQQTIESGRINILQRTISRLTTNENTAQTSSSIVSKNQLEPQEEATPRIPKAAESLAEGWTGEQKPAQEKVKTLVTELHEAVVKAMDGSKGWVVSIILNLHSSKLHSKLQSRNLPKVLPDCVELIKQCFKMNNQIKKMAQYLTDDENLLGVQNATMNNEKTLNWAVDCVLNELKAIKSQPQTPRDLPEDLTRAIDMVQIWSNAQRKVEELRDVWELRNEEEINTIINLSRQASDRITEAEEMSRKVAGLSPRRSPL